MSKIFILHNNNAEKLLRNKHKKNYKRSENFFSSLEMNSLIFFKSILILLHLDFFKIISPLIQVTNFGCFRNKISNYS